MKLLKKDLKELLDKIETKTQTFKWDRFKMLAKHDSTDVNLDAIYNAPFLHDLSCQFAQEIVLLMSEYHKAIEEKKQKPYHDAGYYQLIKGRNGHTKPFSK